MTKKELSEREKDLLEDVKDFVEKEREKMGVTEDQLGRNHRFEGSCIAHGEFKNLLYRQLIYTEYGHGDWSGLSGEVLEGLSRYITNIRKYRDEQ